MILENAIQVGVPLLLENIGETIDSLFEPLLQKKLISQRTELGNLVVDTEEDIDFSKYFIYNYGGGVTLELPNDQYLNIGLNVIHRNASFSTNRSFETQSFCLAVEWMF